MIVRSKAPLRLGLAGGGTDVSPYSDEHGGCVLNVTINMFAYCTIEELSDGNIEFEAKDVGASVKGTLVNEFPLTESLVLHKAVYNRMVRDFNDGAPLSIRVTTYSDAPPGSGLGSSSTMIVAMLAAYRELMGFTMAEYDLAHLAYVIERIDCALAGGKQDQYAAVFGGFNFVEFFKNDRVIVNPLRIRRHIENELQHRLVLYFTGVSRESARIIDDQIKVARSSDAGADALEAMHDVKRLSYDVKERLLKGDLDGVVRQFADSWQAKKRLAPTISNTHIENIMSAVMENGAEAVKISGAGGGGFMMIFIDPKRRLDVKRALAAFNGELRRFEFNHDGVEAWTVR
jgi:D-glycero-alpha-D-manno-heptose-7-phosphate kinase